MLVTICALWMIVLPLTNQLLVAAYLPSRSIVLLRRVHRSLHHVSHSPLPYVHGIVWKPQSWDELRAVLAATAASGDTDTHQEDHSRGTTTLPPLTPVPPSWLWPAASLSIPLDQHRLLVSTLTAVSLDRCSLRLCDLQRLLQLCPLLRSLSIRVDVVDSLRGPLDDALLQHPALHLRSLSISDPLHAASTPNTDRSNHPFIARLDEFAPQLERLVASELKLKRPVSTLEVLGRLHRLLHVGLWDLSVDCVAVPARFCCVTSLSLLRSKLSSMLRLCEAMPLRRLVFEQAGLSNGGPSEPLTAEAVTALLSPSSPCYATLEYLQLGWLHAAPLSTLYELCTSLPSLDSLLLSCYESSSTASEAAASFASFVAIVGSRLTQLNVPEQLTDDGSPPVLELLLRQCVALSDLRLSPRASHWDILCHTLPSRSGDTPTSEGKQPAALDPVSVSGLQQLTMRLSRPHGQTARGTVLILSMFSLCLPTFAQLRELQLICVQLQPPSSPSPCGMPRLSNLRSLTLQVEHGPAVVADVSTLRMWSAVAPGLEQLHLSGGWGAHICHVDRLTAVLGARFPSLTSLSLCGFQLVDEKRVLRDLSRLPRLWRLTLQPNKLPTSRSEHVISAAALEDSVLRQAGSFAQLLLLQIRLSYTTTEWRETCQRLRETRSRLVVELFGQERFPLFG